MISNYEQMPIATYNELLAIAGTSKHPDRREIKIIAHLSGKSEDELLRMDILDFVAYKTLNFAWLAEQPKLSAPVKTYKVGEFNCVFVHPSKWNYLQHITFNQYAQERPNEMQYALSAALVPQRKGVFSPLAYDLNRLQKAIAENMPVTLGQAIMASLWDYAQAVKDEELLKERRNLEAAKHEAKRDSQLQKQIEGAELSIDALRCEWWSQPSFWQLALPELITER